MEIAVRTGKVKVEKMIPGSNPIAIGTSLVAADRLRFDTAANRYELSKEPVAGIGAFVNGKLIYSDASLAEIVHDLSNKYNVNITLATSKLKECRYQISFDDIPLSECLELLGTLTNARIDQLDSRHYAIDGDSCN